MIENGDVIKVTNLQVLGLSWYTNLVTAYVVLINDYIMHQISCLRVKP